MGRPILTPQTLDFCIITLSVKTMSLQHRIVLIFVLSLVLLSGCRKDEDGTSWDVDALAPMVYTSLSIEDLIPDSLVTYDENELVFLSFTDTVINLELDTLIQLPDTSITESFSFPAGGFEIPAGTQLENIEEEIKIESGDIELKYASIQSGTIIIDLISTFQGAVICSYEIPDATLNGQPLTIEELVPGAQPGEPTVLQFIFDVSGYDLDFTNGSEPFNHLPTSFTVTSDPDGPPLPISIGNGFELITTFQEVTPAYAEGYFGQQVIETGVETQEINAFDIIEGGSLDIDQVNIGLRILNGFGADIRATLHQFDANNSLSNNSVGLNHSVMNSPINLNRATHPFGSPIPSVYDIELTESNSDIDLMLENLPDAFEIDATLELNPLGNISNHHDFAYAESTISGLLDINIPLCLIAEDLQLADTTDFSLGEDEALNNVNSGRLIIQITNGFPLEGDLQLEAFNEEGELLTDQLITDGYFAAGMTDENHQVTSSVYSELNIPLDQEIIETLRQAERMLIRAKLSTSSTSTHVKIYNHYQLDVKVVADINYHVN